MSVTASSTRDRYGFLLHEFPAPFNLDGVRWRSVSKYIEANPDKDPIPAIEAKFIQNPQLAEELSSTSLKDIILPDGQAGIDVASVRDRAELPSQSEEGDMIDVATSNLTAMIREMGYILDEPIPTVDTKGITATNAEGGTVIVDVYASTEYPESRLKEMIEAQEKITVIGSRPMYIILGNIDKGNIASIMDKISAYANIKYYSINSLYSMTSKHRLAPEIRLIDVDDPVYQDVVGLTLPEISSTDVMIPYGIGSIIEVMDFSPHYRRVV